MKSLKSLLPKVIEKIQQQVYKETLKLAVKAPLFGLAAGN
jgi:hypothetical protein